MVESITMPKLGESITEGTIIRWLVQIGDNVKKYDPLCEVMTDKVTVEVPSAVSGMITDIVVPEGDTVEVGTVICRIGAEVTTPPLKASPSPSPNLPLVGKEDKSAQTEVEPVLSPAVLKLIQEHELDLSQLTGTGRDGRLTRNDVMEFLEKRTRSVDVESQSSKEESDQRIPATSIRKVIAKRMIQSKHEIPHAWTVIECDVTNLVKVRNEIKEEFKRTEGFNLTYFPFFMKAAAESLREFPILNSQWDDEHIILKKEINLSFAVADERALFTPVIRNADQKDLVGLARSVHELAKKAREGNLTAEDLSGGTFAINNTGSFGSVLSAPIINYPQAAMLTVEAIMKRPALVDRTLVELDKVNICLSMDHRILDGWVCGQFLQSFRQKLERIGPDMDGRILQRYYEFS